MAEGVEALVAEAVREARRRWPEVTVSVAELSQWARDRANDGNPAELRLVDLCLACACARGDAAALAAFAREYDSHIAAIIGRIRAPRVVHDEATQLLRQHLFVAEPERPARIAEYSGRGELLAYVRVVAVRLVLQLLRKHKPERETNDEALLRLPADGDDPELQYLKLVYRKQFKAAFAEALHALDSRSRALLRYHLVDRLSIDKIAAIYDVHRATAARQLARAREDLVTGTHELLRQQLQVSQQELQSIMRLVQSNVDVSAERLLRTDID